jgi:hypothetical protein
MKMAMEEDWELRCGIGGHSAGVQNGPVGEFGLLLQHLSLSPTTPGHPHHCEVVDCFKHTLEFAIRLSPAPPGRADVQTAVGSAPGPTLPRSNHLGASSSFPTPCAESPVGSSSSLSVARLRHEPLQEARHEDGLDGGTDLEDELVVGGDAKAEALGDEAKQLPHDEAPDAEGDALADGDGGAWLGGGP